jgi:heterotetrameric sarcosine oxidase delta subunit
MSFLLACPLCGPRDVYEFRFAGEIQKRPAPGSAPEEWAEYLYARTNIDGIERAWWFHRAGCRRWFQAERDTRDNRVIQTAWTLPAAVAASGPGGAASTTGMPAPASAGAAEPGNAADA